MTTKTQAADDYEPTGDPEHVAYGAAFIWTCTCGRESPFITTRSKQEARAAEHERYCDGTVEIDVV